jgi:AraC-like DNA-binding protein
MLKHASDFTPHRFSTLEVPERHRLPMWHEEFGRGVVRSVIEPLSSAPFRAEATLRALPGMRTIAWAGSPVRNRRTAALVADADAGIGLFINLGGEATASQRGRDVTLCRGDAVLIAHDPSVVIPSPVGFLGVIVPHAELALRVGNIDDRTMRLIPRRNEPLRLVRSYLRSLPQKLTLGSPALRSTVVRHIHDLVALTLSGSRGLSEGGLSALRAARLSAILDCIAADFQNPDLTVATVARREGISPRYLQYLLETSGTSFTARVNELRLQRALALLTDPRACGRRISDVALEVGFSDISHFNRLFRSRFGDTPSGTRARRRSMNETRRMPR